MALFLILRYTGMRRESVASLRVRHLDPSWGLRGVYTKGGKTRDIPLPSVVMKFLHTYVDLVLAPEVGELTGDTPLFWSRWSGRRGLRRLEPLHGKNIWRLCKTYGRRIGVPELKPHDLRHGVAMEVLEQQHDLEQVRALLGHTRIDTTQIYATIRPAQLKRAVSFYEDKAARMLSESNAYLSPARNGDGRRRADGRWETEQGSNADGRGRQPIKHSEFKDVPSMSSNTER
jgi:integrase/recombinase XerC